MELTYNSLTEESLFNVLKVAITDLSKASSSFAYIDCYSKSRDLHLELKCRRTHYSDLLIEKHKWLALKEHKNAAYICSTPRGIFYFDLSKINEPKWLVESHVKTTSFDNTNKVNKVVGYMNIAEAGNISYLLAKYNDNQKDKL
jgi:hypothetical protein